MQRLCFLLLPLLLAGCSRDTDPEDQRFYNRGWLLPHRDIDEGPAYDPSHQEHGMPKQVHPEKYQNDPILN